MIYKKAAEIAELNETIKIAIVISGKYKGFSLMIAKETVREGSCAEGTENKMISALKKCSKSQTITIDDNEVFVHVLKKRPHLTIFGAGHISVPLCSVCSMLGFRVRVVDDRAEFARMERFETADEVCLCPFDRLFELKAFPDEYAVIVTSGHKHDTECAEYALRHGFPYIGMIGSAKKAAHVREVLIDNGFSKERVDSIYSPVGLMIGAQTPEEIAVSIAAQLIQVRRAGSEDFMAPNIAKALTDNKSCTLSVIIDKQGSCPRGVGSIMLSDETGRLCGSVGGGAAEKDIIEKAPGLKNMSVAEYDMASNGLVCGGKIRVLILNRDCKLFANS